MGSTGNSIAMHSPQGKHNPRAMETVEKAVAVLGLFAGCGGFYNVAAVRLILSWQIRHAGD